jgi:hypothetical protein
MMYHSLGSSIWFAYILPSALVIDFSLDRYVRFVDYCCFSSLGMPIVRVTLSAKSLLIQTFYFFRVLMLRRKASPTETELRLERSHMVNEAVEMIAVEWHSEETSEETPKGFTPSTGMSTDAEAQP